MKGRVDTELAIELAKATKELTDQVRVEIENFTRKTGIVVDSLCIRANLVRDATGKVLQVSYQPVEVGALLHDH